MEALSSQKNLGKIQEGLHHYSPKIKERSTKKKLQEKRYIFFKILNILEIGDKIISLAKKNSQILIILAM